MKTLWEKPVITYEQWVAWRARQESKQALELAITCHADPVPPRRIPTFVRQGVDPVTINVPQVIGYRLQLPDRPINRDIDDCPNFGPRVQSAAYSARKQVCDSLLPLTANWNHSTRDIACALSNHLRRTVRELGFEWSEEGELLDTVKAFLLPWIEAEFTGDENGHHPNELLLVPVADVVCRQLIDLVGEVRLAFEPQDSFTNATSTEKGDWIVTPQRISPAVPPLMSDEASAIQQVLDTDSSIAAVIPGWMLELEIPATPVPRHAKHCPHALLKVMHERPGHRPLYLLVDEEEGQDLAPIQSTIEQFWLPGVNRNQAFGDWSYIPLAGDLSQRVWQLSQRLRKFHAPLLEC
jgi:hypothetical protein